MLFVWENILHCW